MRRVLLASGLLALSAPVPALAGGGCHEPNITEGSTAKVVAKEACFSPVVNRVTPGTTITWVNLDEMEHNLTGNGESVGYHELAFGQSVSVRFDKPGTYPYACTLHAGMTGVVVVGDGKGRGATAGGATEIVPTPTPTPDTVVIQADPASWTDNTAAVGGAGAGVLGLGLAAGFVFGRRRPE